MIRTPLYSEAFFFFLRYNLRLFTDANSVIYQIIVGRLKRPPLTRGLSAKLTGGENDYPSVTCGDSSPDKGSLWVRRRKGERYRKATGIVRRMDE